ncbi:MAG: hypothetical protein DCC57_17300 [Chloroflexi bacterium]|nr:MAG: hypothetical protein DCC57_17300 [Chloroflexota bacterium]
MLQFPTPVEIRLENPPVVEVICQVRFPPVLRILNEPPVAFQDAIRAEFPLLETQQGIRVQIDPLATTTPVAQTESRIYRFQSLDEQTVIALAPNFVALSTTAYGGWTDFVRQLDLATSAARQTYDLPYATRIGLRYVDHLTQTNTRSATPRDVWEMLRPELTALWRAEPWQDPVQASHQLVLAASEQEQLTLRVAYRQEEEPVCVLDFDAYVEGKGKGLPLDNLLEYAQRFHHLIYAAFRWCIPEEKLAVFGFAGEERSSV